MEDKRPNFVKCAGCPEPAIGYDSHGMPLCDGCANLPDIDLTFPVVKIRVEEVDQKPSPVS